MDDLKAYINFMGDEKDTLLQKCLDDALSLLTVYVGSAAVPVNILDRCTLMVAADLWERRNAPNGIVNQQYQEFNGVGQMPARIARNPMAGVYDLLRPWVLPW